MWRRTFRTILLCLLGGVGARAATFEKVLVFAGTNGVRISAVLKPDGAAAALKFTGTIMPSGSGSNLWAGPLDGAVISPGMISVSNRISGLRPELWNPANPALYLFKIRAERGGQEVASKTVRFGFRSFEAREGRFWLNGRPIFLRGVAINPPGRGIPQNVGESRRFAEDYVRFLKSQNLNIFRISTDESQTWFDVCDELGMMLYAGRYGAPPESDSAKRAAPADFDQAVAGYRALFEGYASHPSIVEYYLANELPVSGARGAAYSKFLTRACAELKKWDDTRAYIGNAGYGEGREGDVCDVHRYWGWYYNSFLTYYNLRDRLYPRPLFGDPAKNQPLTFTECVGSFTGSSGQFNLIRSKQLAPSLGWIGHTQSPREDALSYQAFMVKQACESFRRMRPQNPRLAGLMPFTILFYEWSGISSFDQMKPKPAMEAMCAAYQPVLLSWELWTPQVYAGSQVAPIAHVINDDDLGRELRDASLEFAVRGPDGRQHAVGRIPLPTVPYFGTWSRSVPLSLPADLAAGEYLVTGRVIAADGVRSTNSTGLFVAGAEWKPPANPGDTVYLYDPVGHSGDAFKRLGIGFQRLAMDTPWPEHMRSLVIGEQAWDKHLDARKGQLQSFVRAGGRVLCLQPDPETFARVWLPQKISFFSSSPNDTAYPPRTRPFREQMNLNPERPDHPVFRGLNRKRLSLWSDYSAWDQTRPGFPKVYPVTTGFRLEEPAALARTAVLADYDRGLEGIALCEMFDGKGSVILSGLDLVRRAGLDPAADRVLANLVAYVASPAGHEVHPLIERPIRWGDYPTERGVVCGSLNGLLVNAEWVPSPIDRHSGPHPPNTGAWNMAPGEQFEPRGRNPFGPYSYSTAASLKDLNADAKSGEGFFWARIPDGKKFAVTSVNNPGEAAANLKVFVNDAVEPGSVETIAAGQTTRVRTPLNPGAAGVRIRYAGEKTLVLLETAFE